MKKLTLFMSLLLLAFVGIKANAAFYLCGAFQGWDPGNAVEMTDNGDGSFTYNFNVTSEQLQFKISTVKNSDWGQFNSGCYGDGDFTLNEEKTLNKGWTGNCKLPAAGELTLTIWDVNSSTCKAKVTPKGEVIVETIESMGIVGVEELGLSWSEDLEMALQAGSDHVWVATKEDVEIAAAGNYDYKARANHKWGFYELPGDGTNYQLNIAAAGTYDIVFTADTENHTLTAEATKQGGVDPQPVEITAVDLMGSSNGWAEPLASFTNGDASTGYWELNDVQFAANDEFKIRVSYSDQSEKWLVPESDGNFLVDEDQLGHELTLTTEGGMNNMYVERNATLSFSLAPGFGALVITGEFVQPEPALTLHHGHDGQNDWQIVEFTYEDGIFTGTVALAEDEVFYFTNEAGAWFPTNENQGAVYELHSGWCTEIPLDGAGCQFFKMAEASTFTFIVQPFNEEYPQFDVEGWPAHDLEMYLYGNITDGGWENGTLMDVLEPNSHWLKYFTVEDVNNGNGYLKLGKAATFSDDTAIGAVDDADNYEVIAESAQALRALQIPMVDGGKAIEIAAGYYAMHVWYNAETGEGRVQFDPQNVPIGKVEILVPDDGLVIEQGQTLQLEAVYTPQYTTNADLGINWLSSDPSIATVDENGLVTALIPEANGAPRRAPSKNADNTVTITASMTNNDGSVIDGTIDITVSDPTGINDLVVDANVASVKYINAMGQMSDRAFDGLNIMVTTYIDGTTSTVKVVK